MIGILFDPISGFISGYLGSIALLMSNQTPFAVEAALGSLLTELAQSFNPEVIVGVPTLELDYARLVALKLSFSDYVALGNSRKFWYDDALSISSGLRDQSWCSKVALHRPRVEQSCGRQAGCGSGRCDQHRWNGCCSNLAVAESGGGVRRAGCGANRGL